MSKPEPQEEKGETSRVGNEELWGGAYPPVETSEPPSSYPGKTPFRRKTLFQILVVGLCAFCAPGIWSAMNGLGVGGSQSPDLVNAANALLYAFMTVTCFLGPWVTNLIGFKYTLAIGSLGYPLYAVRGPMHNLFQNYTDFTGWTVRSESLRVGMVRIPRSCTLWNQCRLLLECRRCHCYWLS